MTLLQVKTKVEGDSVSPGVKLLSSYVDILDQYLGLMCWILKYVLEILYKLSVLSLGVVLFKLYF